MPRSAECAILSSVWLQLADWHFYQWLRRNPHSKMVNIWRRAYEVAFNLGIGVSVSNRRVQ
jgi:hypothetical protein